MRPGATPRCPLSARLLGPISNGNPVRKCSQSVEIRTQAKSRARISPSRPCGKACHRAVHAAQPVCVLKCRTKAFGGTIYNAQAARAALLHQAHISSQKAARARLAPASKLPPQDMRVMCKQGRLLNARQHSLACIPHILTKVLVLEDMDSATCPQLSPFPPQSRHATLSIYSANSNTLLGELDNEQHCASVAHTELQNRRAVCRRTRRAEFLAAHTPKNATRAYHTAALVT